MRKTIKRLGAVLLAMAMAVFVLCTGALAAESTYTLTIQDSNQNHKYTAYQVFAGTVDTGKKLSVTGWGSGVDTSKSVGEKTLVQAIQEITVDGATPFANKTEPGDIAAVLGDTANNSKDNAVATAFADVVANYVTGSGHSTAGWTAAADSTPAHYEITGLTGGYYFVKSANDADKTDVANTRYMLEVVGDATVAAKNGVPTVDKKVQNANNKPNNTTENFADTTTAQVGQTVNFKLTGTLPSNYDYYKNYAYTFDDTLSEGLTLTEKQKNELFVKVYASQTEAEKDANGTDENTGVKLTAKSGNTGNYTVAVTSPADTTKTTSLKVAFDDLKTIKKADSNDALITKNSVIVVYYSATINGSATVGSAGNKNSVKLEYSNDPNNTGTGTTKSDEASVFTFKLDITKVKKGETDMRLAGAKFVLSTSDKLDIGVADNDSDLTDTNVTNQLIKVTGTTPDYVINDGTNASAAGQYIMATAATGDNLGKLNITGLNKGVYYLYETKAPDGYNRITEPIKIEITEDTTTEKDTNGKFSVTSLKYKIGNGAEQTVTNATTGTISANVENTSGSTLPSTGGMGTKLFYTIGGILMAGAAIVLVVRKRRSDAE